MPLRQLYPDLKANESTNAGYVDIIAVHGLNPRSKKDADHAWDTWRKPTGPKGRLWLRDDLPQHAPEARILLYEYNATDVFGNDRSTFIDKANEFLEAIRIKRKEAENRPLVLLGHSLGGLLIEQALVNAHNNPKYTHIRSATTGLAFFGTPHNGGNKVLVNVGGVAARIAMGMGFQKGDDILETLKDGSIFTEILHEHWRHQLLNYEIVSFWGSTDNTVPRESSRFGLPGDRENIVKLNADHSGVCRFDDSESDQDNLEPIQNNIEDLYEHAVKAVQRLVQDDSSITNEGDQRCLHALFVTNPLDEMARIPDTKDMHLKGTCTWISVDPAYKKWLHHDQSSILWVHGDPGKGKTMLAISQITQLTQKIERMSVASATLAYFFCDDKDDRRNNAVVIIRSLLYQLLCQRPALVQCLRNDYEKQREQLFSSQNAQQSLWRIFESVLDQLTGQTTWFVVDALDECEPESAEILLKRIKSRVRKQNVEKRSASNTQEKWLLTSRNEPRIKENMFGSLEINLELNSALVSHDVRHFIVTKVQELVERKKYPEDLKINITRTLQKKAEGTFLWVSLACAELRKVQRIQAEKALERLPSGLNAIYERLLSLVLGDEDEVLVREILVSVLIAIRPLTVYELAVVAGIPVEYSGDAQMIREYLERCGSFLVIRKQGVYFVHQSAKDYLSSAKALKSSVGLAEEHKRLTIRCLDYICSGVFDAGPVATFLDRDTSDTEDRVSCSEDDMLNSMCGVWVSEDDMSNSEDGRMGIEDERKVRIMAVKDSHLNNPPYLLKYPILFWMTHGRLASPDLGNYFNLKHEFYSPASRTRKTWLHKYNSLTHSYFTNEPGNLPVLHFAAYSGILPLVHKILQRAPNEINVRDSSGSTALYWASVYGHAAVVQLLLEKGADVNMTSCFERTALLEAAAGGNVALTELLLEKGAHVNIGDTSGNTALCWAAQDGYENVARLLLEKGAPINAKNSIGDTALHIAASNRRKSMVQILLEKGAHINAKNIFGNTVLHIAALKGLKSIAQLLLDNGADTDVRNRSGGTVLHEAVLSDDETMVQLLLDYGTDINIADLKGNTALHQVAFFGLEKMVSLLLKKGADINIRESDAMTALDWATKCGYQSIVRLLEAAVRAR